MQNIKIFLVIISIIVFCPRSFAISPNKNISSIPQTIDSSKKTNAANIIKDSLAKLQNSLPIDTALNKTQQQTVIPIDTVKKLDSALIVPVSENVLTNTKLFIYIILSVLGLGLFFFIFVINLFKTFHKKKSTRQSLLLSWNLFFIVSIIWIFIIWGLVAGFWISPSFMIVVIFLFIISLIMTIIAIKSK